MEREDILKTEYSNRFDELRKNRMIMSFYKYGPVKVNYEELKLDAITNLRIRLELFERTRNKEHLADIANFAMIEFEHGEGHFNNITESPGLGAMTYRDIENLTCPTCGIEKVHKGVCCVCPVCGDGGCEA